MQRTVIALGWSLCTLAVLGGAPLMAAEGAAAPSPSAPTSPAVAKKADPRQVAALVQQGTDALAVGDAKAARDSFSDAAQLDPKNARALHGLAVAYARLGDFSKAAAAGDKAVAVPGAIDHALAMNAAVIQLQNKAPMRAAKITRDYLTAKPAPLDEAVANALGLALDRADAQQRKNSFYTDSRAFYDRYIRKLEAANPGYLRWGPQWLPADDVQAKIKTNADSQVKVAKLGKELADLDSQLAVASKQMAAADAQAAKGQIDPSDVAAAHDNVEQLIARDNDKKKEYAEAASRLSVPDPLPELVATVPLDAPVPAIVMPVKPTVVASSDGPENTDGGDANAKPDKTPARPRFRRRQKPGDQPPEVKPASPEDKPAAPADKSDAPADRPADKPDAAGDKAAENVGEKSADKSGGKPAANDPPADPPADAPPPEPAPHKKIRLTTYAAAFPVAGDLVVTAFAAVDGAHDITLQARDGSVLAGTLVRSDAATGLALVRITGVKLAFLALADARAGGVQCAAFPEVDIFAPQGQLLAGTAPVPAANWLIRFAKHPRLAGAPLIQDGKVVGVAMGDRGSDIGAFPAVPIAAVQSLLAGDAPQNASMNPDPVAVLLHVSAVKEREQE